MIEKCQAQSLRMFWTSPVRSLSPPPSSTSSLFLESRICCISLSCFILFHLLSRSGHSLRRPTRHNSATHPACFYPASPPSSLQDHLSPIWFEVGALNTVRGVSDHGQVVSSTILSHCLKLRWNGPRGFQDPRLSRGRPQDQRPPVLSV